jgi:hypothetical protein
MRITKTTGMLTAGILVLSGVAFYVYSSGVFEGSSETLGQQDAMLEEPVPAEDQSDSEGTVVRQVGTSPSPTASVATRQRTSDSRFNSDLRARLAAADALDSEQGLLLNNRVDFSTASQLLPSDDDQFQDTVDALHAEMIADALAMEINDIYQSALDEYASLGGHDFRLGQFACGLRVCLGELHSHLENPDWSAWLSGFSQQPGSPPIYVNIGAEIIGPDGFPSYRILISTDPDSRGVVVPNPDP